MAILSLPFSWRTTLLLVYLVANFKSLPFAWHIRILYHFLTNVPRKPIPPKPLPTTTNNPPSRRILTHPLFAPTQISTHTPLLETDYNLHKSNATYLSDMDVSRTKLVTRLFSPGFRRLGTQLEKEGYRGRMLVALGAAHVSFRREISIYERVRVRSRVLGWDRKWLVVVTYFVRARGGRKRGGEEGEELCAVGLSKYVLKKGRFTVRPERVFRTAGWLPEKADLEVNGERALKMDDRPGSSTETEAKDVEAGLTSAKVPEFTEKVILDDNTAAAAANAADALAWGDHEKTAWNAEAWSWEEIEEERLRGLRLADGWLALDGELCGEFETN